ncbi:MAG: HDIG domain-containing protein [Clostridiales bacterium]|nr:HDIG domain-containing protein [Clostridiales bacterium]
MSGAGGAKVAKGMERLKDFLHSPKALRLLICIVGVALLAAIFEVAIVPVRYDLRVGMVPTHTISATKDVVDEGSTEKRRAEAAAAVTPTYYYAEGVTETVLADFDQIFAQLRAVRQYGATLLDQSPNREYSKDELQYARDMLTAISLRDYQLIALLHSTQEELEEAYSLLYSALQSIMQGRVIEGKTSTAIASVRQIVDFRISIPLGQNVVPAVLNACVKPNMLIDQEATEKARQAARDAVEPVVYKQGQNIVVRGEGRITSNQLAMLSTLGLLSSGDVDITMYLGAALMMTIVLGSMIFQLHRPYYHLFDHTKRLLLLFIILVVTLGLCVLARLINIYLAPTLLGVLLITALLGMRPAIICNTALTILVATLAAGSSEAYTETMVMIISTGMLSGTVAALILNNRVTRLRVLFSGLAAVAVDFLIFLAMGLMTASELSGNLINGAIRAGGTLISTLLCIGLQPLLETAFNLATPMKLMELSNPNQPLLRRLLLEAPGTYHHSTIVASLAEAAAEAIGANPLLARVGGYYHDVGKLKRPLYFKENQMGDRNVHDYTDPLVSAAIVTSHTQDGVTLAKQYRLPQEVLNIIGEHHGNTPVMFFYHKALQLAGGKPVDINTFRYSGRPPKTREGAVVLLCDTIEAAVRTLKNPTPESIEEFILKLVRGKLEDGQLSDSPLTLQDIDKICMAATTVLTGVFHERIEYPDVDEIKKQEEPKEEAQKGEEQEKSEEAEQPMVVAPPEAQPMPVIEVAARAPLKVVTPEAPAELVEVAPPPAIEPVAVADLVRAERMPLEEEAQAQPEKEKEEENE